MDDHETLAARVVSGLTALQEAQQLYDSEMWDIADPKFANLRHIQIHLAITVGKLARLLEPQDHRLYHGDLPTPLDTAEVSAIVADLLIHAAQIANIQELDLGAILTQRYRRNAARFAPEGSLVAFGANLSLINDDP